MNRWDLDTSLSHVHPKIAIFELSLTRNNKVYHGTNGRNTHHSD